MIVLQVKYCYTEEEANKFLSTLHSSSGAYPRLHTIQYCAKIQGDGVETEKADVSGITAQAKVESDVIAVVQYFMEI